MSTPYTQGKLSERLHKSYLAIEQDCALVTATDKKYAPFLFNTLMSIHANFPSHPRVYVFDLGMTWSQRAELAATPWITVVLVPIFVEHWKTNWSWKPYILTKIKEKFVLYFDSANIVLHRSLQAWFLCIKKHGYFVVSNGQRLHDITPSNYWETFNLDARKHGPMSTFGAGLIGYNTAGPTGTAIRKSLELTMTGMTLGRSQQETNPIYDGSALHDCPCFRADQTLLNLAFREIYEEKLVIRDELRYCGCGGANDHRNQYLWYSRRNKRSMIFFWRPLNGHLALFLYNRLFFNLKFSLRNLCASMYKLLKSSLHQAD